MSYFCSLILVVNLILVAVFFAFAAAFYLVEEPDELPCKVLLGIRNQVRLRTCSSLFFCSDGFRRQTVCW